MGFLLLLVGVVLAMEAEGRPEFSPHAENRSLSFQSDFMSSAALNVKLSFQPYEETWANFKQAYGRKYSSREESFRRLVFIQNLKKIEEHNHKFVTSASTYWMGINQFTDMTVEEYRLYNKLQPTKRSRSMCEPFLPPLNFEDPATIDWRTKGYVTPVKDQGQCGSCWAFSTTGSLEGQHYRATGRLVSLSEQQLVDCSRENGGCDGGFVDVAFGYIKKFGGLQDENGYPYIAEDGRCHAVQSQTKANLSSCRDITQFSESDLQRAVASQGPISVAIDASHESFQSYAGGVYYEPDCSQSNLDHAVLVVGYGNMGSQPYWLVKNSWATKWGADGYVMMAKDQDNMCGIATQASFPVV